MALRVRRSSARGLPIVLGAGSKGAITAHWSSVSSPFFTPSFYNKQITTNKLQQTKPKLLLKPLLKLGAGIIASLLCIMFGLLFFSDALSFPFTFQNTIFPLGIAALFPAAFCAFHARRVQSRKFAVWGILATIFTYFYTGFFYLDGAPTTKMPDKIWTQGNRTSIERNYRFFHTMRLYDESDKILLQTGIKTFAPENPVVPIQLRGRDGAGYIVPQHWGSDNLFVFGVQETVGTVSEARVRWQTDGPKWLAKKQASINEYIRREESLRVSLEQTGFAKTASWYSNWLAAFTASLLGIDFGFAVLGRAAYIRRREKRTKRA